ncbi:Glucosamine--fructose-6-phosphate aminotransferase [isomerizing] [uncultured Candidatus Thioglobus sp.]|nr:Glucosamine--fructose-6-phosphate aminotransferase [isomerizing] [uncultured Candidatus Thioglobus sp.]
MCGIIGGVAQRDITAILLEGLRRLEYRGYDSAGVALINDANKLERVRVVGKIQELEKALVNEKLSGKTGIAHTRWATHGKPSIENSHPHIESDTVALVHNGIVENHEELRAHQETLGYQFKSSTDSEVIVKQIYNHLKAGNTLLDAVLQTIPMLRGSYTFSVINHNDPNRLIAVRSGSPLVIGVGIKEYFIASDIFALLTVTKKFIFLKEGDVADITTDKITIYDKDIQIVTRPIESINLDENSVNKDGFRHYMLKEIYAQPVAIKDTLEGKLDQGRLATHAFGNNATNDIFSQVKAIQIVACGTSYHAGLIAKYWIEDITNLPCFVEVASEFRYRKTYITDNMLFVTISQSGETADTLASLKKAKKLNFLATLTICNVVESSITRESDIVFLTHAGKEISVASTKAFTTQLVALLLFVLAIGRHQGLSAAIEKEIVAQLDSLPEIIVNILKLDEQIGTLARSFINKNYVLYLGRGDMLPIAMEGALKLKEISYIHAEAYPAGELKHGPLALVDDEIPIIALAPNNALLEKLQSNLHEVVARGGKLYIITDVTAQKDFNETTKLLLMPLVGQYIAPIVYTVPLQLLAYHIAILKGADVDQPRNLAKSVTVE